MVTCGGDQCAWLRASLMEDLVRVRRAMCATHSYPTLNHWRARSGVDPPRPIPNRVVKHSSAEGTARLPCGRLGLCANTYIPRRGAVAARWAHNPKVSGSNPLAATNQIHQQSFLLLVYFCVICDPQMYSVIRALLDDTTRFFLRCNHTMAKYIDIFNSVYFMNKREGGKRNGLQCFLG